MIATAVIELGVDSSLYSLLPLKVVIFTVHKRSCEKLMFSQAYVKNSGHREGRGGVHIPPPRPGQAPFLGRHPLGRHSSRQTIPGQTPPKQTPPWADTLPLGSPSHGQTPSPWPDTLPLARHPPPWQTPSPWADTPLPSDGHCSGRYASYWNAFLLRICLI